jgi:hypothetical protein
MTGSLIGSRGKKMTSSSVKQAAAYSRYGKAISKQRFTVSTKNGDRPAHIVISPGRNPVFVYASCPTIVVHEQQPTTRQVDNVSEWEAF